MHDSESRLYELRRRACDKEKRQLSSIFLVGWVYLSAVLISLVLLMDYRRFESEFHELSLRAKDQLAASVAKNEAVLEGFGAFISGLAVFDEAKVKQYADRTIERFPHIFMMEVAEKLAASDTDRLVARMRSRGYHDFELKAFDYSAGTRAWRPLPTSDFYYPLIFMYPLADDSRQVLGLDMGSHEQLAVPLDRAFESGSYQTSLPFQLIEGDDAYVMFMPVHPTGSAGQSYTHYAAQARPVRFVLIVLRTQDLLSPLEDLIPDSWGFFIYHTDRRSEDPTGWLVNRTQPSIAGLHTIRREYQLESGRQGFVMRLETQFGLNAISVDILILLALISSFAFFLIRTFILIRYRRDLERAQNEARLKLLASYDALTQLPNRTKLLVWLQDGISSAGAGTSVDVVYLDLDNFKEINNRFGHATGDVVLHTIAERIRCVLGEDDLAVRLGGNEFVIALKQTTANDNTDRVVARLTQTISEPFDVGEHRISVGVSVGVARYPDNSTDPVDLLHVANQAMYRAKRGRQRYETARATG